MFLQFYKPHPALQELVSRIMLARYTFAKNMLLSATPFPPQPEHCLYLYPYDQVLSYNHASGLQTRLPHSIVVGPQLSRVDLTLNYNMLVIYIGFQPGGLHRLLHVPMQQLINTPVEARLLLGKDIDELTSQLPQASGYDAMIQMVETYLLQKMNKLKKLLPVEQVLTSLVRRVPMMPVDQLARQACVSVRQLERQFNERIGIPPKVFFRLVRFSQAWRLRETYPAVSWTSIAYQCGYADQMHMIRDFKDFAGVSPTLLQAALQANTLRLQAQLNSDHLR